MRVEPKCGGARRLLVCAVAALCVAAQLAPVTQGARPLAASTVRGRVDRRGKAGNYPAPYIRVTLRRENAAGARPLQTYTERSGMYYFRELPPGDYILEVWDEANRAVAGYRVRVLDRPFTDVTPVVIP